MTKCTNEYCQSEDCKCEKCECNPQSKCGCCSGSSKCSNKYCKPNCSCSAQNEACHCPCNETTGCVCIKSNWKRSGKMNHCYYLFYSVYIIFLKKENKNTWN